MTTLWNNLPAILGILMALAMTITAGIRTWRDKQFGPIEIGLLVFALAFSLFAWDLTSPSMHVEYIELAPAVVAVLVTSLAALALQRHNWIDAACFVGLLPITLAIGIALKYDQYHALINQFYAENQLAGDIATKLLDPEQASWHRAGILANYFALGGLAILIAVGGFQLWRFLAQPEQPATSAPASPEAASNLDGPTVLPTGANMSLVNDPADNDPADNDPADNDQPGNQPGVWPLTGLSWSATGPTGAPVANDPNEPVVWPQNGANADNQPDHRG